MKKIVSIFVVFSMFMSILPLNFQLVNAEDVYDSELVLMLQQNPIEAPQTPRMRAGIDGGAGAVSTIEYPEFAAKRLLIKLKNGASLPEIDNVKQIVSGYNNFAVVQFYSIEETAKAYFALGDDPAIEYVEEDAIVTAADYVGDQQTPANVEGVSAGNNNGAGHQAAAVSYKSWGVTDMGMDVFSNALVAANKTSEILTVAVLDTGVDITHPFLKNRVVPGISTVDDEPYVDKYNHGTHVAGIIADATQNLTNVKIMPIKVLDNKGSGTISQISAGVKHAAVNGADIANLSLSGINESKSLYMNEYLEFAKEYEMAAVVSAGNSSADTNNFAPSGYDYSITVSALHNITRVEEDPFAYSYSNFGNAVDFCAPGSYVNSSVPGGEYAHKDGTSMAAPHISAALALVELWTPGDTNAYELQAVLSKYCKGFIPTDELDASKEWNAYYGFGEPKLDEALTNGSLVECNVPLSPQVVAIQAGYENKTLKYSAKAIIENYNSANEYCYNTLPTTSGATPINGDTINDLSVDTTYFIFCRKSSESEWGTPIKFITGKAIQVATPKVDISIPSPGSAGGSVIVSATDNMQYYNFSTGLWVNIPKNGTGFTGYNSYGVFYVRYKETSLIEASMYSQVYFGVTPVTQAQTILADTSTIDILTTPLQVLGAGAGSEDTIISAAITDNDSEWKIGYGLKGDDGPISATPFISEADSGTVYIYILPKDDISVGTHEFNIQMSTLTKDSVTKSFDYGSTITNTYSFKIDVFQSMASVVAKSVNYVQGADLPTFDYTTMPNVSVADLIYTVEDANKNVVVPSKTMPVGTYYIYTSGGSARGYSLYHESNKTKVGKLNVSAPIIVSSPSPSPSPSPSILPSPSAMPSPVPSAVPSVAPSAAPSVAPSAQPSASPKPTTGSGSGGGGGGGGGTKASPKPSNSPSASPLPSPGASPITPSPEPGADVDPSAYVDINSHWAKGYIDEMITLGVINGYDIGNEQREFLPENPTKRSEFVKMLAMLSGDELTYGAGARFSDVRSDQWYAMYIDWASARGITGGYEDGEFRPNNLITRQEMAIMLVRFMEYKGIKLNGVSLDVSMDFGDIDDIASWAKGAMQSMVSVGIINGDDLGNCNPLRNGKRCETAAMLSRIRKIIENE
ncbi:MAG: S8 family serine peptidase [Clostridiales bacterium]|jgi:hypothetical protein|nr:S8 family serine peptidase [Clostridiales bacterium]